VPLPRLVDWSRVGDGSVFDPMPAQGELPEEVWRDPDRVKAAYAESVAYTLDAVTWFVQQLHDRELVLVVLGDHQPASIVAGQGASNDVPVSIIAADRAVVDRATDWGWQDGLRPDNGAPVWPMVPSGTGSSPLLARSPRPRPRQITERVRESATPEPRPVSRRGSLSTDGPTMRSLRSQSQASCIRTAGASCPHQRLPLGRMCCQHWPFRSGRGRHVGSGVPARRCRAIAARYPGRLVVVPAAPP